MSQFAENLNPLRVGHLFCRAPRLARAGVVGLVCACLLTGCSGRADAVSDPLVSGTADGLICSSPVWDLGEVLVKGNSVDVEHTFRLKNRAHRTITIRDVRSDCGCLVANDYSKTIEPGDESEIKVTISVFGPPGGFRKTLFVREESESTEGIALSVVGTRAISDLLYSSPATINFGTLTKSESKIKELILSRFDGSPVNFRNLVCKDNSISLTGKPSTFTRDDPTIRKSCECIELPVRLDLNSQPLGPFNSKITIQTDSSDKSTAELTVVVEAMIVEDETPWAQSIFVKRLEHGASVEKSITKPGHSTSPPKIVSTSYEGDEALQLDLVPASPGDGPGNLPKIRVSRSVHATTGGLARGTLILHTEESTERSTSRIGITVFLPE